jgi:hypothetical protein
MSTFDADSFMSSSFNEANETKYILVPEPQELEKDNYVAMAKTVEARPWQSRDGSRSGLKLRIGWAIDDPEVSAITGVESPVVYQDIMLDLLPNGGLAFGPGKNIALGRLREALGQNVPGKPWSPTMIQGQVARVVVKHRIWEDENAADDERFQKVAEVKAVTKLTNS